jgi:GntR family transcriptional regulator, transcriptional repressor for pyruvate dehydrogenase complex
MKIEPIRPNSAPERVVRQILRNLENGEMRPGQKLPPQEQLAKMFQVGRSSIREATNALAFMGYLEISQGKGTFIRNTLPSKNLSLSHVKDFLEKANLFNLMEIREVLETYVVKKAADRANTKQLIALQRALENLAQCRESSELLVADLEFHVALTKAADNPEIGEIVKMIHTTTHKKLPVIFTTSRKEKIEKTISTAKDIVTHIIRGEGSQAVRSMRNHLDITNEDLKKELLEEVI